MIDDLELAGRIVASMDGCSNTVNEMIALVQERCSDAEFQAFRKAAGRVMGYIYTEVVAPLHHRHPELEPPEFR